LLTQQQLQLQLRLHPRAMAVAGSQLVRLQQWQEQWASALEQHLPPAPPSPLPVAAAGLGHLSRPGTIEPWLVELRVDSLAELAVLLVTVAAEPGRARH